jgi:hypothetical protein
MRDRLCPLKIPHCGEGPGFSGQNKVEKGYALTPKLDLTFRQQTDYSLRKEVNHENTQTQRQSPWF